MTTTLTNTFQSRRTALAAATLAVGLTAAAAPAVTVSDFDAGGANPVQGTYLSFDGNATQGPTSYAVAAPNDQGGAFADGLTVNASGDRRLDVTATGGPGTPAGATFNVILGDGDGTRLGYSFPVPAAGATVTYSRPIVDADFAGQGPDGNPAFGTAPGLDRSAITRYEIQGSFAGSSPFNLSFDDLRTTAVAGTAATAVNFAGLDPATGGNFSYGTFAGNLNPGAAGLGVNAPDDQGGVGGPIAGGTVDLSGGDLLALTLTRDAGDVGGVVNVVLTDADGTIGFYGLSTAGLGVGETGTLTAPLGSFDVGFADNGIDRVPGAIPGLNFAEITAFQVQGDFNGSGRIAVTLAALGVVAAAPVPEPASLTVLGAGVAGVLLRRRRP